MENNSTLQKITIPIQLSDELESRIRKQSWREAITYRGIAPHEYFINNQNQKLFDLLSDAIEKYGEYSLFRLHARETKYKCLNLGTYRYWQIEDVLNRCKLSDVRFVNGAYEPKLPER